MHQVAPYSPGPERRATVDERLAVFSNLDRRGGTQTYILDRSSSEYKAKLHGLRHFFSHIRSLCDNPTVCDIGTGKGSAIKGLKTDTITEGINFIGTNLTDSYQETVEQNIGKGNHFVTAAEELVLGDRPAKSVHGFLGVYSIAESGDLPTVAKNLDYYLAPGGAIKVMVYPEENGQSEFVETLQELGYNVAVIKPAYRKLRRLIGAEHPNVVLAIKPDPTRKLPTAQELMSKDRMDFENS